MSDPTFVYGGSPSVYATLINHSLERRHPFLTWAVCIHN